MNRPDSYKISSFEDFYSLSNLEDYILESVASCVKSVIPCPSLKVELLLIKIIYYLYFFFFLGILVKKKQRIFADYRLYYTSPYNLLLKKIIYKKTLFSILAAILFSFNLSFLDSYYYLLALFARFIVFYFIKKRKFKIFSFNISRHLLITAIVLYIRSFSKPIWKEIPFLYNELAHIAYLINHIIVYLFKDLLLKQMPFLIFTKNFFFLNYFLKPLKT